MYDVLSIVLYLLVTALVAGLIWLVVTKIGAEKMQRVAKELEMNKELAAAAVRYAQQVYWNIDGPIRYQKAAEWMVNECTRYGIRITVTQLKGLIEDALRTFKDEFGEEWAKATNVDSASAI